MKYLDLANQKAIKASAMEDAKAYFDKAMDSWTPCPIPRRTKSAESLSW